MTSPRKRHEFAVALGGILTSLFLLSGLFLVVVLFSMYPVFIPYIEGVWKRYHPPQAPPGIIKAADAKIAELAKIPDLYIRDPQKYVPWQVIEKGNICLVTYCIPASKDGGVELEVDNHTLKAELVRMGWKHFKKTSTHGNGG